MVACEANPHGNWDIHLLNLSTGEVSELIGGAGHQRQPAWSPDGRMIAYIEEQDDASELRLYEVETRTSRTLQQLPGRPLFPAWSPDENRLAVTLNQDGVFGIWLLELDDDAPIRLPFEPKREVWPRWSPDGGQLMFFSRRDTDGQDDEVYLHTLASAQTIRLTDRPGHDFCPAWSPDGVRIIMVSVNADNSRALRIVDRTGKEIATLAEGYFRVTEPVCSPSGTSVIFAASRADGAPYQLRVESVAPAPAQSK